MTPRCAIKTLLVLALALPIVVMVLWWVGGLLTSMGDAAGAAGVGYVSTVCRILWALAIVGLVIAVGWASLEDGRSGAVSEEHEREIRE